LDLGAKPHGNDVGLSPPPPLDKLINLEGNFNTSAHSSFSKLSYIPSISHEKSIDELI
jgi:hypothetical protein